MLSQTPSLGKKEAATVWRLRSLSLTLPQIRISVIKLIKVMHANMPLGSRPDFICHTFVESCRSFTFDVAFYIIENNWIPSPPSTLPCLVHTQIHTEFAHVLSQHALLIDLLCCRSLSVASKGFRQRFSSVRPKCSIGK